VLKFRYPALCFLSAMTIYYDSITWFEYPSTGASVALVLLVLGVGIVVFRGNAPVGAQSASGSSALPLGMVTFPSRAHFFHK
jgi:hypothetical protein